MYVEASALIRQDRFVTYRICMSTQREVLEGHTGSHRTKRANFGRGGPGVLLGKISKTYIANGAIYVIPELYL